MWLPSAVDGRLLVFASSATVHHSADAGLRPAAVRNTECQGRDP